MDIASFVLGQASAGGGGTTPTQTKTATPTTSAQDVEPDSGYLLSKVTVGAIPSQYIVPAGKKTITENGTDIDVSQFATADVAVPSSGGSSYTLLHSEEITDNYSTTSMAEIKTISLDLPAEDTYFRLYVKIRDKAGPRNGYFYGSDTLAYWNANASPPKWYIQSDYYSYYKDAFSVTKNTNSPSGIYASSGGTADSIPISHRYGSTGSRTINGTYTIEVYLLDYAPGGNPFS